MWVKYLFSILFTVLLPRVSGAFKASQESLEASNLPFRYELDQVACDFQEKLRKELSVLEMEMYNEFLQLVQEIDSNQRSLTQELTTELSKKVHEVMGKFTKVMTYSTQRTQILNNKMKELTSSLGNWVEHGLNPSAFSIHQSNSNGQETISRPNDDSERKKRHTNRRLIVDGEVLLQDVSEAKKLLELDPEDFPVVEDIDEIDDLLETSICFDGHLESRDSDFTLRELTPGTNSRYTWQKEQPQEEVESTLTREVMESTTIKGELELTPTKGELKLIPTKKVLPRNCYDLLQEGSTQNGIYVIYPSGRGDGLEVWCDQESEGGGWTAIVNRRAANPHLNFTAMPTQYAHGLGAPPSNHWIGLEVMYELTQGRTHALRVHLQDLYGNDTDATYDTFRVRSIDEDYTLEIGGYDPKSTAEDALSLHSGRPFIFPLPTTGEGCSHALGVGWWYLEEPLCYQALATGHYQQANDEEVSSGIEWTPWTGNGQSLQSLSFMVRPSSV